MIKVERRESKTTWITAVAAFLCIVLTLLAVYVWLSIKDVESARKTGMAYLMLLQQHDFVRAYDALSPPTQQQVKEIEIQKLQDRIEKRMGLISGKPKLDKWYAHFDNNGKTFLLHYQIPFQRGVNPVRIKMTRFQGRWRVDYLVYEMGFGPVRGPVSGKVQRQQEAQ